MKKSCRYPLALAVLIGSIFLLLPGKGEVRSSTQMTKELALESILLSNDNKSILAGRHAHLPAWSLARIKGDEWLLVYENTFSASPIIDDFLWAAIFSGGKIQGTPMRISSEDFLWHSFKLISDRAGNLTLVTEYGDEFDTRSISVDKKHLKIGKRERIKPLLPSKDAYRQSSFDAITHNGSLWFCWAEPVEQQDESDKHLEPNNDDIDPFLPPGPQKVKIRWLTQCDGQWKTVRSHILDPVPFDSPVKMVSVPNKILTVLGNRFLLLNTQDKSLAQIAPFTEDSSVTNIGVGQTPLDNTLMLISTDDDSRVQSKLFNISRMSHIDGLRIGRDGLSISNPTIIPIDDTKIAVCYLAYKRESVELHFPKNTTGSAHRGSVTVPNYICEGIYVSTFKLH